MNEGRIYYFVVLSCVISVLMGAETGALDLSFGLGDVSLVVPNDTLFGAAGGGVNSSISPSSSSVGPVQIPQAAVVSSAQGGSSTVAPTASSPQMPIGSVAAIAPASGMPVSAGVQSAVPGVTSVGVGGPGVQAVVPGVTSAGGPGGGVQASTAVGLNNAGVIGTPSVGVGGVASAAGVSAAGAPVPVGIQTVVPGMMDIGVSGPGLGVQPVIPGATSTGVGLPAGIPPVVSGGLPMATPLGAAPGVPLINPRIAEVKSMIGNNQDNFKELTIACKEGMTLLSTVDEVEKNKRNDMSLLSLLRKHIPRIYSQRSYLKMESILDLKSIIEQARLSPYLNDVVLQPWVDSVGVLSMVLTAQSETDRSSKMRIYTSILDLMNPGVALFERKCVMNGIVDLFSNRHTYADFEITALKVMLDKATDEKLRSAKIYQVNEFRLFDQWKKILDAHMILVASMDGRSSQEVVELYSGVIQDILSSDANIEAKIFLDRISVLFSQRGNFNAAAIDALKKVLDTIKNVKNFISSSQMTILRAWIDDLKSAALLIAQRDVTYIEALIDNKSSGKELLRNLARAAHLFTEKTDTSLRNKLINRLNTMLVNRSALKFSQKDLISLLKYLSVQQLGGAGYLFNDKQRSALIEWIKILEQELSAEAYSFDDKNAKL